MLVEDREELEETRFWGVVLRVLWSMIVALGVLAALVVLIARLDWYHYLLFCLMGLGAGLALSAAIFSSPRGREASVLTQSPFPS